MAKPHDELPDYLLAALQDPDVELPGEQEAMRDVLNWLIHDPGDVLPCDQFIWKGENSTT